MTTVEDLLNKNRFYKNLIYRIEDEYNKYGWTNYEYIGRDKFGQILMQRPINKQIESLGLFDKKLRVKKIKI